MLNFYKKQRELINIFCAFSSFLYVCLCVCAWVCVALAIGAIAGQSTAAGERQQRQQSHQDPTGHALFPGVAEQPSGEDSTELVCDLVCSFHFVSFILCRFSPNVFLIFCFLLAVHFFIHLRLLLISFRLFFFYRCFSFLSANFFIKLFRLVRARLRLPAPYIVVCNCVCNCYLSKLHVCV